MDFMGMDTLKELRFDGVIGIWEMYRLPPMGAPQRPYFLAVVV
jgi:hypothetical protein